MDRYGRETGCYVREARLRAKAWWGRCTQARCPITNLGLLLPERREVARSFSNSFVSPSSVFEFGSYVTGPGPGEKTHARNVMFPRWLRSEVNWKPAFFDGTTRLISRIIGFWRATVESSAKMNYSVCMRSLIFLFFSATPSFSLDARAMICCRAF